MPTKLQFILTHTRRQRWMVVDDNADLLHLFQHMIELIADIDVVPFNDSTLALMAHEEEPLAFDRVITDYQMPGMDGMELCRRLRWTSPELNIFLATSEPDVTREDAHRNGFDGLISKPFTLNELRSSLMAFDRHFSALQTAKSMRPRVVPSNPGAALECFLARGVKNSPSLIENF